MLSNNSPLVGGFKMMLLFSTIPVDEGFDQAEMGWALYPRLPIPRLNSCFTCFDRAGIFGWSTTASTCSKDIAGGQSFNHLGVPPTFQELNWHSCTAKKYTNVVNISQLVYFECSLKSNTLP